MVCDSGEYCPLQSGVLMCPRFAMLARQIFIPGVPMRQIISVFLGLLFVAVLVGCGPQPRSGEITGTVTYNGQPVGGAALQLYSAVNADPITIPVDDEGKFRIADVPQGDYKVVVQGGAGSTEVSGIDLKRFPPEEQAKMKEKLDKMHTAATIKFPKKYQDVKKTDLTCKVTAKNEKMDLVLKD
jgi:hypothetical protein